MGTKFINWNNPDKSWPLDIVADIVSKIKGYADKESLENASILEVEDNTWSDPTNNRYDITIMFTKDGHICQQKLLFLNGELIDGEDFHKRFSEFYPR